MRYPNELAMELARHFRYSVDASGHEHKGPGEGGGQFTGHGEGQSPDAMAAKLQPAYDQDEDEPDETAEQRNDRIVAGRDSAVKVIANHLAEYGDEDPDMPANLMREIMVDADVDKQDRTEVLGMLINSGWIDYAEDADENNESFVPGVTMKVLQVLKDLSADSEDQDVNDFMIVNIARNFGITEDSEARNIADELYNSGYLEVGGSEDDPVWIIQKERFQKLRRKHIRYARMRSPEALARELWRYGLSEGGFGGGSLSKPAVQRPAGPQNRARVRPIGQPPAAPNPQAPPKHAMPHPDQMARSLQKPAASKSAVAPEAAKKRPDWMEHPAHSPERKAGVQSWLDEHAKQVEAEVPVLSAANTQVKQARPTQVTAAPNTQLVRGRSTQLDPKNAPLQQLPVPADDAQSGRESFLSSVFGPDLGAQMAREEQSQAKPATLQSPDELARSLQSRPAPVVRDAPLTAEERQRMNLEPTSAASPPNRPFSRFFGAMPGVTADQLEMADVADAARRRQQAGQQQSGQYASPGSQGQASGQHVFPGSQEQAGKWKSKATVMVQNAADAPRVEAAVKNLFGGKVAPGDTASLVGAPDDAIVRAFPNADGFVLSVFHKDYEAIRTFKKDANGNVTVKNNSWFMEPGSQGQGLGADVFEKQVQSCKEAGVKYIETHAARGPSMNGYYTWARFGYDQELDYSITYSQPNFPMIFPGAKTVLDIMDTPDVTDRMSPADLQKAQQHLADIDEKLGRNRDHSRITGADWWNVFGNSMYHAKFDLADGSRSIRTMQDYLEEKRPTNV